MLETLAPVRTQSVIVQSIVDALPFDNYWQRFGLNQAPFEEKTQFGMYYPLPQWQQLLQSLKQLSNSNQPLMVLTGVLGSGKSTLVAQYMAQGDHQLPVCLIRGHIALRVSNVLEQIDQTFKLSNINKNQDDLSAFSLLQLSEYLQNASQRGVIIVDDAHRMPLETLSALIQLAADQASSFQKFYFVLVGEAQLQNRVQNLMEILSVSLKPAFHEIKPLALEETKSYLNHRLAKAGLSVNMPFTEAMINRIQRLSGGVPGRINRVARQVLLELATEINIPMQEKGLWSKVGELFTTHKVRTISVLLLATLGFVGYWSMQQPNNGTNKSNAFSWRDFWQHKDVVKNVDYKALAHKITTPIKTPVQTAAAAVPVAAVAASAPQTAVAAPVSTPAPIAPTAVPSASTVQLQNNPLEPMQALTGAAPVVQTSPQAAAIENSTAAVTTSGLQTPTSEQSQIIINAASNPINPIANQAAANPVNAAATPVAPSVTAPTVSNSMSTASTSTTNATTTTPVPAVQAAATPVNAAAAPVMATAVEQAKQPDQAQAAVTAATATPPVEAKELAPQPQTNAAAAPAIVIEKTPGTDAMHAAAAQPDEAAAAALPKKGFTVQVYAANNLTMVQSFTKKYQSAASLSYYKVNQKGKEFYVVVSGQFENSNAAKVAMNKLPAPLKQLKPWVRPLSSLQNED